VPTITGQATMQSSKGVYRLMPISTRLEMVCRACYMIGNVHESIIPCEVTSAYIENGVMSDGWTSYYAGGFVFHYYCPDHAEIGKRWEAEESCVI